MHRLLQTVYTVQFMLARGTAPKSSQHNPHINQNTHLHLNKSESPLCVKAHHYKANSSPLHLYTKEVHNLRRGAPRRGRHPKRGQQGGMAEAEEAAAPAHSLCSACEPSFVYAPCSSSLHAWMCLRLPGLPFETPAP